MQNTNWPVRRRVISVAFHSIAHRVTWQMLFGRLVPSRGLSPHPIIGPSPILCVKEVVVPYSSLYPGRKHEVIASMSKYSHILVLAISFIYVRVSGLRNNNGILSINTYAIFPCSIKEVTDREQIGLWLTKIGEKFDYSKNLPLIDKRILKTWVNEASMTACQNQEFKLSV